MKWRDLGVELLSQVKEYDENFNVMGKLDMILKNNPGDVEECCTKMFTYWLQNVHDASWNKLVAALKVIGYTVLAKELEEVRMLCLKIYQRYKIRFYFE